ncbi:hypothetical protein AAHC03_016531 [Spirometra sp. Aus1]
MLHNASLVIDDIEDGSSRRRGRPAAHMLFGVPMSINAANYAYFLALEKALALGHSDVPRIFTEQMLDLHRGQGLDIYWRCSCTCPTEQAYDDMVIKKTGGLFGMAVKFMQLFSSDKRDFTHLLDILGLWFQVRDDFANLVDESYHDLKDFADDITEGKFSYPVVHAINAQPHDRQVLSILRQHTSEYTVKQYCIGLLADMGSLDHTAKRLVQLETQCRNIVADLGGNPHLEAFLSEFSSIYRLPSGEPRTFQYLGLKSKKLSHIKPVSCGDYPSGADQPSDSGTGGKSRFELLEESFGSPVVSGLQLFSNYREGLVDPESVCTQPVASKPSSVVAPPAPLGSKTTEGPRVPASWLKPRHPQSGSSFGKLCGAPPLLQLSPVKEASNSQGVPQKVPLTDLPDPSRGTRLTSQAAASVSSSKLLVNFRQRGNPLLELLRNVAWEYADIQPDYLFGPSQCAFFLSLRYHNLNPEYIFERLQKIREAYKLTVLIVLVDVDDSHHPLKELDKFGLTQNVTVMLAWSPTEAARYLETFKTSINKPPDDLLPDGDAKNDHLALATGFLTSLRHISKSDAAALLTKFGSIASIMKADVESLESCPGIGGVKAQKLHDTLRATFKRKILE